MATPHRFYAFEKWRLGSPAHLCRNVVGAETDVDFDLTGRGLSATQLLLQLSFAATLLAGPLVVLVQPRSERDAGWVVPRPSGPGSEEEFRGDDEEIT
ncbi:hypothetical protein GGR50DRAFT_692751 [Xylaria sp. CBS 124048]|nr:hypothetical protein GGR50DRAFT_692751 [Xylaria sp. CBS 124048]